MSLKPLRSAEDLLKPRQRLEFVRRRDEMRLDDLYLWFLRKSVGVTAHRDRYPPRRSTPTLKAPARLDLLAYPGGQRRIQHIDHGEFRIIRIA